MRCKKRHTRPATQYFRKNKRKKKKHAKKQNKHAPLSGILAFWVESLAAFEVFAVGIVVNNCEATLDDKHHKLKQFRAAAQSVNVDNEEIVQLHFLRLAVFVSHVERPRNEVFVSDLLSRKKTFCLGGREQAKLLTHKHMTQKGKIEEEHEQMQTHAELLVTEIEVILCNFRHLCPRC